MTDIRKTFAQGRMNLDVDNRLIQDGEYREAFNAIVTNNESNEEGSVKKSFSNKKITNIDLGVNPKCVLAVANNSRNRVYWGVVSNNGSYLLEYDFNNDITTFVLKDTRGPGLRVFDLKEDFLCTGVDIINAEDEDKELFLMTDDNMEPLCFNIKRAKSFGENGFEKEDIFLIKPQPKYPLKITPITIQVTSNNLLEKMLTFSYRYKYIDGEYSAPSDYVNYQFTPKKFDFDYYTNENKGMVNAFNALKIKYNTGRKTVTNIEILMKESNSNTVFIVESISKIKEGYLDNEEKEFIFSNNKLYTALPEREYYRTFDNVPTKAKAQTVIGNQVVYGNYTEGRNLIDEENNEVFVNFDVSLINTPIDISELLTKSILTNTIIFSNPDLYEINEEKKLILYFSIFNGVFNIYNGTFYFAIDQEYATLKDMFESESFTNFLIILNNDLANNFVYELPTGWILQTSPSISYSYSGGNNVFTINPIVIEEESNPSNTENVNLEFFSSSYASFNYLRNSSSAKTNRDYEVVLLYEDEFKRKTTALQSNNNTIYIKQQFSNFKNNFRVRLYHKPPYWAKTFKFAVKSQPLEYQTIYVNRFYNEGFYTWCKLEAENKDKVKIGDTLIIKKGPDLIPEVTTVKVLDIKEHAKDFIVGNLDVNGNPIIEEQGYYMKIRPNGFSMDQDDYDIRQSQDWKGAPKPDYPVNYLNLFSTTDPLTHLSTSEIAINQGSSVTLYMKSSFNYDSGWRHTIFEYTWFAQRNYSTIEEFFNENIINTNMYAYASDDFQLYNYRTHVTLVRGHFVNGTFGPTFLPGDGEGLYLRIVGTESGGSNNRFGYLESKLVVRNSTGFYVFETEPKKDLDAEIYYESEEVFDIVDGNHFGNIENQDKNINKPAVIDLSWFNCYCQGNGVESYRVKDGFNTKFLHVDLKPTAALIEKYKEIRRVSDLTYGEAFIESSGVNGLNVFNLSTGNFKDDLDKQYGSIQKLHSRENDIVVFQEDKTGKVLYNKQAIYTAEGNAALTSTPIVLGKYIPYYGNRGIGTNPESFSIDDFGRIKYASVKTGNIVRLSIDGIEEIVYGVKNFFRDLFINRNKGKIISGYDPYLDLTVFTIEENINETPIVNCGNEVVKNDLTEPFGYVLKLNNLTGEAVFSFNITYGYCTIIITYNGIDYVSSNVTGLIVVVVPIDNILEDECVVVITPITEKISFSVTNSCPIGIPLSITSIVLCDPLDENKTITNRFKWGGSQFFNDNHTFSNQEISLFDTVSGIEGIGKFPLRDSLVFVESLKNNSNTGRLDLTKCNKLYYLITENVYTEDDIVAILSEAIELTVTSTQIGTNEFIESSSFVFTRPSENHNIYLIWDYTDKSPITNNDSVVIVRGETKTIYPLINDLGHEGFDIIITEEPEFGTANVLGGTIIYNNNGTLPDSIKYKLSSEAGCDSNESTITIQADVSCVCFTGGTFKGTGDAPITFSFIDCFGVPGTVTFNLPLNPEPGNNYDYTVPGSICVKENTVTKTSGAGNSITIEYNSFCIPNYRSLKINPTTTELSNCETETPVTTFGTTVYYNIDDSLVPGTILYYDVALSSPITDKTGGWIHFGIFKSLELNSSGEIINIIDCTPELPE